MNERQERFTPLEPGERLSHVDSLRGFALFGILLVNSMYFQYGMFSFERFAETFRTADSSVAAVNSLFFEGSFYPLFSMLFGFGAVMIWQRTQEKGRSFGGLFFRRMVILAFLGLLHTYLIWDGDILLTYGLSGLFLLLFIKCKPATILGWAVGIFLLIGLPGLIPDDGSVGDMDFTTIQEQEISALSEGTYTDALIYRVTADPFQDMEGGYAVAVFMSIFMGLQIIALFLTGAYLAKKGWIHRPAEHRRILIRIASIFFPLGLTLKGAYVFTGNNQLEYLSMIFGGPFLTLGYIAAFLLLHQAGVFARLFTAFGYVGRMALSNYLSQSVIMTLLYFNYGFGLFAELGLIIGTFIVIVVFVLQILASRWWLSRFAYGPVEWFWRVGTYMRPQSLKRK
ncbi:DUF418 domain-containing protein [Bacillus sp. H-16]|uniref:DUF418 domain-containing protein n=1 Tax=Alteribacter salitolerans TaxID=2912333 RepID=UPI001965E8DB|nr:DUF418 domain-containing protein [Alteribacter salitolerans]MBM7094944.1 DUF418 domain-containing protein [Alteribacter salitolerans]